MSVWKVRDPSKYRPEFTLALRAAPTAGWVLRGLTEAQGKAEQRRWGTFLRSCRAFSASDLHADAMRWKAFTRLVHDGEGSWGLRVQWRAEEDMERALGQALEDNGGWMDVD